MRFVLCAANLLARRKTVNRIRYKERRHHRQCNQQNDWQQIDQRRVAGLFAWLLLFGPMESSIATRTHENVLLLRKAAAKEHVKQLLGRNVRFKAACISAIFEWTATTLSHSTAAATAATVELIFAIEIVHFSLFRIGQCGHSITDGLETFGRTRCLILVRMQL